MDSVLPHFQSALGIVAIIAIAWAASENRKALDWRILASGLGLQLGLALLLRMVPLARDVLFSLNGAVTAVTTATRAGTGFVFGYVGGGGLPFTISNPGNLNIFAFSILPIIIVISALSA